MKAVAQILLFDRDCRLLIYLRDDNPAIPFPNHWDLFGGHLEAGETPERALVREVKEELGVGLTKWEFFRRYDCLAGDVYPNVKFIFYARLDVAPAELTLHEGQRLASIDAGERYRFRFANILSVILDDFVSAGIWPRPVDNSRTKNSAQ